MATIGMLTIVIVSTSSLISNGMIGTRMGSWDNIARNAAIAEMERIKARPWSDIVLMPIYPSTGISRNFCTAPNGAALPANDPDTFSVAPIYNSPAPLAVCTTGLLPGMLGRVYVERYDANGDGAFDSGIRKITTSVSVYQISNPLANLLQPLFDTTAYAQGGGGGGSARSVWRITTLVSQNGFSEN